MNKKVLETLRQKKTVDLLATHDDADGLTAAVLLRFAYDVKEILVPEEFGDGKHPEKDQYADVMLDMVPLNKDIPCIVFDHHPTHVSKELRKYQLIFDSVPTSLIVFECFKDLIPEKEKWKVAVGLVGDGQPELIPSEVWKACPELLYGYSSVYEKYGKVSMSPYPVYIRLSSGLNATCKLGENKWHQGYEVLKNATKPLDLIEDPSLLAAKEMIAREYKRIISESRPIDLPYLRFWRIKSEFRMERHLAPIVMKNSMLTTLLVNEQTNKISLRGNLTLWICEELNKKGYKINGHPGFAGGELTENQTIEKLYEELKKLKL